MSDSAPSTARMLNPRGMRKSEVGEVRPSQALTTFGIGSLVDLPNLSVLVMGLEDWREDQSSEINEERLLQTVQKILGPQVRRLLTPPRAAEAIGGGGHGNWFDESHTVGVPVAPFPRWLVCSSCRLLAPISSGLFEAKVEAYRPDRTRYVHNCTTNRRSPVALPARFVVACPNGHLDDFPWLDFVHRQKPGCNGPLELYEVGASGEASDVEVHCRGCDARRRMAEAFGRDNQRNLPPCRGRRPHLRDIDPNGCSEPHVRAILQGASNSWFSVIVSALSIPQATDKLGQLVDDRWDVLDKALAPEVISAFRAIGQLKEFTKYTDLEIWAAVQKKRQGSPPEVLDDSDLKSPEWAVLSNPILAPETNDFRLLEVEPPAGYEPYFERIVLAEKLREVKGLVGFTRIQSPRDFDLSSEMDQIRRAPLSRQKSTWVPSCETRGEGIFFQFNEAAIVDWQLRVTRQDAEFRTAHERWRRAKQMDPSKGYPGLRYILLHSFAHAVIRQLAVECGYTTAAIAERIYARDPADGEPMAGVLIYTSAPDSEGTLGGLSALGEPQTLGRHLDHALDRMGLCSSDPLCAEHTPTLDGSLHAAACHACSFLPETSCERGNRYLDRSLLVVTVERPDLAFFTDAVRPAAPKVTMPARASAPQPARVTPATTPAIEADPELPPAVAELLRYCDERCVAFIRAWAATGRQLPVTGYELSNPVGRVCGQAELAWQQRKVAVVLPEHQESLDAFRSQGWTVLTLGDLDDPDGPVCRAVEG